jgi:Ca2+-binding EF-hand superfamily protein
MPGGPLMQHQDHGGMLGGGMMGHEMIGHEMMGHSVVMRIIFGLMDANGDGKLSLEEFQAAHERIFKAMDADHDGTVTLEEMEAFMHGH